MRRIAGWLLGLSVAASVVGARAEPVLISQDPWGQNADVQNFTTVFGAGQFDFVDSFVAADPAAVFSAGNRFVMIEGGAGTDVMFQRYLTHNQAAILGWVQAGGVLLLQSAGWDAGSYGIGPGSLVQDHYANASHCGVLTIVGQALLGGATAKQCGGYLAHDYVTGAGLTPFMTGSDTGVTVVAAARYGAGEIVYSGLTDCEWNYAGPGLEDGLIERSSQLSGVAVPEPPGVTLLVLGLASLPIARRLQRK